MTTAVDSRQLIDFSEPLNQNALIHKTTNEFASFCTDNIDYANGPKGNRGLISGKFCTDNNKCTHFKYANL